MYSDQNVEHQWCSSCWTLEAVNQTFFLRMLISFENFMNPLNNKPVMQLWFSLLGVYVSDVLQSKCHAPFWVKIYSKRLEKKKKRQLMFYVLFAYISTWSFS